MLLNSVKHPPQDDFFHSGIGSDQAFGSAAEQREHFRSDWHRLNVRRRAAGRAALSEEEFERHVQEDAEVCAGAGRLQTSAGLGHGATPADIKSVQNASRPAAF